ncbi:hypothetical protein LTR35_004525 [Friedmanniomyces endolithicus]|uniref:Ras-like GTP-binding protein RYL2 n=1 Tax=Friedmanniomyces endolithicus TaxID=329885 RepID=A0AAN6FY03_9PEZI|nr:hypothetical protein LTR35_004525 [Friedmanniomyces endolithicus]KAK0295651.1 hypothetical protein LTS00_005852 [Friedmanniomyces endolithicus]KAK0326391.1 hypothetical protein LTR82_002232 [Friedmanniomyces endolithicus]
MTHPTAPPPTALEAKLVVLGSQGVGKTSLVHRYVKQAFEPPSKAQSTIGASFLTTRVHDPESGATLRLQIWDTAGQERFRSISRLYYRGAHAAILCYDVTSARSFEDMGVWLEELKGNCGAGVGGEGLIVHVVGTKSDVVAEDPRKREVPFERCISYVAEHLFPETIALPPQQTHSSPPSSTTTQTTHALHHGRNRSPPVPTTSVTSPHSNRSSGFWGQEALWDCCHEISAKDGEGIDEVFRVITRKLVERHVARAANQKQLEESLVQRGGRTPAGGEGADGEGQGYFDLPNGGTGSFRVGGGGGDKRRSWLGFPSTPGGLSGWGGDEVEGREREEDANPASPLANRDCMEDLPQELNFDHDSVQYAWLLD